MRQQEATLQEPQELRIKAQGQEGDLIPSEAEKPLICTEEAILYAINSPTPIEIPHEDITEIRSFTDKSLTGFFLLGHLFLFITFLLTALSIQLIVAGAPLLDVVTIGTYLSTVLAYPTALMFYKMEVGEAHVLRIETSEERFEFITTEDEKKFDRIYSVIQKREPVEITEYGQ
ncbi:hypothetical protein [Natrarchaeobaculum sulfurireducens]|uniref:hypothetical protein n=1 Tax=Natrarchaeobaculum sulfurireducens TaxID=2044521 RepID=UPI000E3DD210|nr:hypothetical protein [Natrarchaeobaculum sulfurireducens]